MQLQGAARGALGLDIVEPSGWTANKVKPFVEVKCFASSLEAGRWVHRAG